MSSHSLTPPSITPCEHLQVKFLGGEGFDPVSSMTNNVHDSVEGGRYPFDSDKKNNGLALLEDSSSRLMGQRSPTTGGSLLSLSQQSSTTTLPNLARSYPSPLTSHPRIYRVYKEGIITYIPPLTLCILCCSPDLPSPSFASSLYVI